MLGECGMLNSNNILACSARDDGSNDDGATRRQWSAWCYFRSGSGRACLSFSLVMFTVFRSRREQRARRGGPCRMPSPAAPRYRQMFTYRLFFKTPLLVGVFTKTTSQLCTCSHDENTYISCNACPKYTTYLFCLFAGVSVHESLMEGISIQVSLVLF